MCHGALRSCIVATLLLFTLPEEVLAVRAIPDDNLAYPVLIALKPAGGLGSGFFLNTADAIWLVTARHVLFGVSPPTLLAQQAEITAYPRDPKEQGRNVFTLDLTRLLADGQIRIHPSRDVSIVKIATNVAGPGEARAVRTVPGVVVAASTPSGILGVSADALKKYDDVLVANDVFVFGYPTSLGLTAVPQLDLTRPLLRRGIIAGVNPGQRSIILDCPVYPGNSGGPVLEVEEANPFERQFRIIGVVSQFVPFVESWVNRTHGYENSTISNSGYSVVTPVDFVLELLQ